MLLFLCCLTAGFSKYTPCFYCPYLSPHKLPFLTLFEPFGENKKALKRCHFKALCVWAVLDSNQ